MIYNKLILFAFTLLLSQSIMSQSKDTCEKPIEDPLLELNSISKCSIEEEIKPKSASSKENVNIEATTRRRIVRNRSAVEGVSKTGVSQKITSLKQKTSLVGTLDLSNEEVIENLPFNSVEEIPVFDACERAPLTEQNKCFKKEISKHIIKNFKYPDDAYDNSIQGRVYAQFIINEQGLIENLRIRGPYKGELLEKETERIIKKLPKFKPGKHDGREVKVKYGLPINFKIPGKKPSNIKS